MAALSPVTRLCRLMDDLNLNMDDLDEASIFTGEDEVFAWQRLVSRLGELQSEEYWEMCHKFWKAPKA